MSKQSSSGELPDQKLFMPERVRAEQKLKEQKAGERRERARQVLLVAFAFFAVIATFTYFRLLQPRCTPLQSVPGSSVYLFACYPGALGIGDEGQIKVTVINNGPGKLVDVKVFLVCPTQLRVGVEVNASNMIQFDDLDDEMRKTGEVKLSPGEIFLSGDKVEFSLRVTGVDAAQAGSVIDDTLEGGTFPLLPFSVNSAMIVFQASVSASVLSALSAASTRIWEWLTKAGKAA